MTAFLDLRVVPNASRSAVVGRQGGALKVKVSAPAVEGKANAALLEFLAESLDLKKNRLSLVSGASARTKRVAVEGVTPVELDRRIEACLPR